MTKLYLKRAKKSKTKIIVKILAINVIILALATNTVGAESLQSQITSLQQNNSAAIEEQAKLQAASLSIADRITSLQASIATLQNQIKDNQNKSTAAQVKIIEKEAEINEQRKVLNVNVRTMYLDDQVSTLEKLASSKNFSYFVDKEEYQVSVQNKIRKIMAKIEALKKEREAEKQKIDNIIKDQSAIQQDMQKQQSEANQLLALNQQQIAEYEKTIVGNKQKIASLQAQQAAENAKYNIGGAGAVGANGYPWNNVPFPNTLSDPWGMYKRQCVSYAAWKVASTGRYMPYWGGRGNAKLWDDNARSAGIPTGTTPRVGSVAVSNAGTYGHVMYVEIVHGDGTITVSQYNAGWDGRYSVTRRSSTGLVYIYF